jgi:hypothetical protein
VSKNWPPLLAWKPMPLICTSNTVAVVIWNIGPVPDQRTSHGMDSAPRCIEPTPNG